MKIILIVVAQSAIANVPSSKSVGDSVRMCMLKLKELGTEYAPSYAVKLFPPWSNQQYQPGELVAVSLRFKATENPSTGQMYQDVIAEEIVKINNIKNNKEYEENLESRF